MKYTRLLSMVLVSAACGVTGAQPMVDRVPTDNRKMPGLEVFVEHAGMIKPFARTETGRAFLDAVGSLPNQLRRYLWVDRQFKTAYTEAEYSTLDENQKRGLNFRPVTELAYYMGISERPLMDVVALDLVVRGTSMASPEGLAGKKILLYNPRVITQGRLLASLGADVTIVQDQQRFSALYSEPGDVGVIEGFGDLPAGKVRVVRSNWPAEGSPVPGSGFDLIIAVDWISKGLSTTSAQPPRWITPGSSLHPLPCSHEEFVSAIAGALAPGGGSSTTPTARSSPVCRPTRCPTRMCAFPSRLRRSRARGSTFWRLMQTTRIPCSGFRSPRGSASLSSALKTGCPR